MSLEKYAETQFKGVITDAKVMTLSKYLGDRLDAFRDKMRMPDSSKPNKETGYAGWSDEEKDTYKDKRLAADVIVVYYDIDGQARDEFVNLPTRGGYSKSNLSKIVAKNGLPTSNISEWKGLEVWCQVDSNGYYELSK